MDDDSFTSLAWPPEPAEATPTETLVETLAIDVLLPPECQLANPIDYNEYFGPDAFKPTVFPTRSTTPSDTAS